MSEARIAVLESKVATMESADKSSADKADELLKVLSKLDTKSQLFSMTIESFKKTINRLENKIILLEEKESTVKKWKKNTIVLATVIGSTIASLLFPTEN